MTTDNRDPKRGDLSSEGNAEMEYAGPEEPSPSTSGKTLQNSDPFDPASLRLNPSTAAGAIGVKRKYTTLKCDKPEKMDFVRVHPSTNYHLETAVIQDKRNRESYLVSPALWREFPDFIALVRLCAAVTRHGVPFIWLAKLPDPDGRAAGGDWHQSMLQAQEIAVNSWVRVQADMSAGSYAVFEATGARPEPEWPDLTFKEMLELSFKNRLIDSPDHPFVRELLGEV